MRWLSTVMRDAFMYCSSPDGTKRDAPRRRHSRHSRTLKPARRCARSPGGRDRSTTCLESDPQAGCVPRELRVAWHQEFRRPLGTPRLPESPWDDPRQKGVVERRCSRGVRLSGGTAERAADSDIPG